MGAAHRSPRPVSARRPQTTDLLLLCVGTSPLLPQPPARTAARPLWPDHDQAAAAGAAGRCRVSGGARGRGGGGGGSASGRHAAAALGRRGLRRAAPRRGRRAQAAPAAAAHEHLCRRNRRSRRGCEPAAPALCAARPPGPGAQVGAAGKALGPRQRRRPGDVLWPRRQGAEVAQGRKPHLLFDGGTKHMRKFPKVWLTPSSPVLYKQLGLSKVLQWVRAGRLDPQQLITMKDLRDSGCVSKTIRWGVELVARGTERVGEPLHLEVSSASPAAKALVEAAGGSVTRVYYTRLGLRALLKPEVFEERGRALPRPVRAWPPRDDGNFDAIGQLPPAKAPLPPLPPPPSLGHAAAAASV